MKKRIISAALSAALLTGTVRAADLSAVCDSQKRIISVSMSAEEGYSGTVLIYLTDDNEDGFTLDQITGENVSEKLKAFGEAAFREGKFSGQLVIPENIEAGWYTVTAEDYKAEDDIQKTELSERQTRIYIADQDMVNAAVAAVNSASESNIDSVFSEYKDVLGIALDEDYNSDAGKIFLAMKKEKLDTIAEIYSLFTAAKAAGAIKNASADSMGDMLLKYGSELGIELGEDYEEYKDDIHTLLAKACGSVKNGADAGNTIKELFEEMTAVGVLNNSNRTEITEVLKKYNSVFELNLDGEYAKTDRIEFNKALERKNFESAEDVRKAFNDKLASLDDGKGSGGSSSGGGGGRDTTTYKPSVPSKPTDPPKEPEAAENDPQKQEFNDLQDAIWAQEAIYKLAEKKIVSGYSDGSFKPDNNITRNEFITMLVLAFDLLDEEAVYDFTDGDSSAWYAKYMASAKKAGILAGYSDGSFGDAQEITREDMAVFVYRISEIEKEEAEEKFSDDADISDYAREAVYSLYSKGIIKGMGDNKFAPSASATRAQAAKIIYSVMEGGDDA